jgi:hypothetical protein
MLYRNQDYTLQYSFILLIAFSVFPLAMTILVSCYTNICNKLMTNRCPIAQLPYNVLAK